jgi:CRISPR system Cascade subunit CasB
MNIDTEQQQLKTDAPRTKSLAFVDYIINCCQSSNGTRAALKRADNSATEYQSWEVLAGFQIDLENENQRMPYTIIAAGIARSKVENNGSVKIGPAISRCYEDGNTSDQAKAKLRRLLSCDSVPEVCRILRPLLSLIESKGNSAVDYASLLDDLLWFGREESQLRIKARWAQDFYGKLATGGRDE